jgi:hypothetical protein
LGGQETDDSDIALQGSILKLLGGGGGGVVSPEAEPKEKHGGWDPMPELTVTSPYVHYRVDSMQHIYNGQPDSRVDFIPQSGTLDLASVCL